MLEEIIKDINKNMNEYVTRDFPLSAYLVASDIQLLAYRKNKNGQTVFVFKDTETLQDYINKYFSPSCLVNVRKLTDAMRTLKGYIHRNDSISE